MSTLRIISSSSIFNSLIDNFMSKMLIKNIAHVKVENTRNFYQTGEVLIKWIWNDFHVKLKHSPFRLQFYLQARIIRLSSWSSSDRTLRLRKFNWQLFIRIYRSLKSHILNINSICERTERISQIYTKWKWIRRLLFLPSRCLCANISTLHWPARWRFEM